MPNDRLLRYSIAGVSFLFFFFFFLYLFGKEIPNTKGFDDGTTVILSVLSVLLTAPVLGVIISSTIFQILYWSIFRMKMYFILPKDREIEDWVLEGYNHRSEDIQRIRTLRNEGLNKSGEVKYKSTYLYEYFPYYQIKVREFITGSSLDYLERKLSVFYVHLNVVGSIVLSFIFALTYNLCSMQNFEWEFNYYKLSGIFVLIVYVIGAIQLMLSSFHHATEFEHLMLEQAFQKEKKNKNAL